MGEGGGFKKKKKAQTNIFCLFFFVMPYSDRCDVYLGNYGQKVVILGHYPHSGERALSGHAARAHLVWHPQHSQRPSPHMGFKFARET